MTMCQYRGGVLAALAAVPLLAGCAGATSWLAGEPEPGSVRFAQAAQDSLVGRASWRGEVSQAQSAAFLVARSQAEWGALWDLAGRQPPGALPDGMMAVGVFVGTRTRTGYQVDVVRILLQHRNGQRDRLLVEYREVEPMDTMITGQMLTSPYVIVLIDRSEAPVSYARLPPIANPTTLHKDNR